MQAGTKLTVNQTSTNATLNWQSFNISADGTVQFVQPSATAVALNQINDANATQIFGALNANGRVFLINQNGIIFGAGAQVNVGGLVASTLNINPMAVSSGLIAPGSNGQPAFQAFASGPTGSVAIDSGRDAANRRRRPNPDLCAADQQSGNDQHARAGRPLLAAGNTIYLAPTAAIPTCAGCSWRSAAPAEPSPTARRATAPSPRPEQLVGQIIAERGNVTLAGLAVNQLGRVSATTSINENGSIRLQAGDHGSINASNAPGVSGTPQDGTGGTLVLGARSDTEVTLDSADPSTTVDSVAAAQVQHRHDRLHHPDAQRQRGAGDQRHDRGDGRARHRTRRRRHPDGSRFYLAPGAELDVSGASIALPVSINVIPVQLRGTELADSPLQQNGPLRSQTVYVDIRQGTPLADISGEIAAIGHNVVERNLTGGTITIQSRWRCDSRARLTSRCRRRPDRLHGRVISTPPN